LQGRLCCLEKGRHGSEATVVARSGGCGCPRGRCPQRSGNNRIHGE
jgi:hypothetical protein